MKTRRKKLLEVKKTATTHAGLWLDKYIEEQEKKDKDSEGRSDKDQNKGNSRSDLVKEVATLQEPEEYKEFFKRWKEMLDDYGTQVQTREAQVKGRMIVGLGSESVLETSVTLHHTYGVPYIPGSALKGLAASYARQRLGNTWEKDSPAYNAVFGDTDNAGYIIFFDALYIPATGHEHKGKKQALYPDVITVHHPKYYQEGKNASPSDWDSPNPVPFLSATGKYLIALAAPDIKEDNRGEWLKKVFEILRLALEEMGIGAKTSSGYGRMKVDPPRVDPALQKAEQYKIEVERMPDKDVANQIQSYYQKWQQMSSDEARKIVARVVVDKVRRVGREKQSKEKSWYKELLAFLGENAS